MRYVNVHLDARHVHLGPQKDAPFLAGGPEQVPVLPAGYRVTRQDSIAELGPRFPRLRWIEVDVGAVGDVATKQLRQLGRLVGPAAALREVAIDFLQTGDVGAAGPDHTGDAREVQDTIGTLPVVNVE